MVPKTDELSAIDTCIQDAKGRSTMTIASRKRFLNVDEAAEYLETTKRNVYRLAEQNRLAHHRIARRLQFTVSDLEKYIEAQRVEVRSWDL
jgi:excisionase family DNA binding protein